MLIEKKEFEGNENKELFGLYINLPMIRRSPKHQFFSLRIGRVYLYPIMSIGLI